MIPVLSLAFALALSQSPLPVPRSPQPMAPEASGMRVTVRENGGIDAAIASGSLGGLLAELVRLKVIQGVVLDESVRELPVIGDWSADSAAGLLQRVLAGRADIAFAGHQDRLAVGRLDFVLRAWDVKESLTTPANPSAAETKDRDDPSDWLQGEVDEAVAAQEAEEGALAHAATMVLFTAAVTAPRAAPGTVLTSPFAGPEGEATTSIRGPAPTSRAPVVTPFSHLSGGSQTEAAEAGKPMPPPPPGSGLEALYRVLGVR